VNRERGLPADRGLPEPFLNANPRCGMQRITGDRNSGNYRSLPPIYVIDALRTSDFWAFSRIGAVVVFLLSVALVAVGGSRARDGVDGE
jgi:hypothetical protein